MDRTGDPASSRAEIIDNRPIDPGGPAMNMGADGGSDQMVELDVFPILLAVILFLLLVNVLAMRSITTIKV